MSWSRVAATWRFAMRLTVWSLVRSFLASSMPVQEVRACAIAL